MPKNPTKLDPKDIDISKVPQAGRLSEVGQKILSLGGKKAHYITTMDWGVGKDNSAFDDLMNKKKSLQNHEA